MFVQFEESKELINFKDNLLPEIVAVVLAAAVVMSTSTSNEYQ